MWHPLKLLSCLAAVAAAARSSDGTIFIFDTKEESSISQSPDIIHEDVAILLLQQRMLSTQDIPSIALEESVVELLNNFGGNQNSLYNEAPGSDKQKLLILAEGLVKDNAAISLEKPTSKLNFLEITTLFFDALIVKSVYATEARWKYCEYEALTDHKLQASRSNELQNCLYQHPVFIGSPQKPVTQLFDEIPLSSFKIWSDTSGNKAILRLKFKDHLQDPSKATQLLTSLSELFDSKERTIVLLPQTTTNSKFDKYTTEKHDSVKSKAGHVQSRRSQQQIRDIPSTLLPVCHNTNNSCTSSTNSCSGHGVCYLKSAVQDSECYACKCDSQWGGSACQKIDISTQFFLIGTVTILAILAVGGAVSMLFSVGQEELPSVISAGVSSTKASSR